MPKLSATNHPRQDDSRTKNQPPAPLEPRCRPCPRCFVPLVLERQYRSRGLSGTESLQETYVCPACDARFHHNPSESRWRELS